VREIRPPAIDGQILVSEDREGSRWQIECLGEPVDVGGSSRPHGSNGSVGFGESQTGCGSHLLGDSTGRN